VGRPPVVPCRGSHGGAQRIAHRPARCRRGVAVTPASGRSVYAEWMSIRWSLAFPATSASSTALLGRCLAGSSAVDRTTQLRFIEPTLVSVGWLVWYSTARTARRVPPSASLATDHSGRASAPVGAGPAGLKCICPRRQRFTRSGPADLGEADRDGRGCVAANGECAGRSLRAGRRAVLVGDHLMQARSRSRPVGRSRRRERERADGSVGRCRRKTAM